MSKWSDAVDNLFDSGEQVSFASLVEAEAKSKLDQEFEAKRTRKWGLDSAKIEPKEKINPREYVPKKNNDDPCRKTIERYAWLQDRWKMKGLQLVGQQSNDDELTDEQRCELFNNRAIASDGKLLRLDFTFIP